METSPMTDLGVPPILSTPDAHILEDTTSSVPIHNSSSLSDEQLALTYEIEKTVREIKAAKWQRVALQFPDEMLPDAPRVFQALSRGLKNQRPGLNDFSNDKEPSTLAEQFSETHLDTKEETKFYILGDTSYGACCVDEVAAEHVDAQAVIHYGRSCLSPTARLPVSHVFTQRSLEYDGIVGAFKKSYPNKEAKIVLAADVLFASHVQQIHNMLQDEGYANIFATSVIHDPSSPIPNRTVPQEVQSDPSSFESWDLFHISEPPTSLLLTLSSRVASIRIYPTDSTSAAPLLANTAIALRRRYALLTSLNTVSVFGILINTLSVKNYLHMVEHVKAQIAAAGKKSYMFVVGKLNAAKVANFGEIGGWVVIGCWESSLVDSKDFWKPVITPFELELVLKGDAERVWTGEWKSDFQRILDAAAEGSAKEKVRTDLDISEAKADQDVDDEEFSSEPESAPPEFDLRTGRYVSHTRPMAVSPRPNEEAHGGEPPSRSAALIKRAKGEITTVGGAASPGAEFLRNKRTWQGLGSDFNIQYEEEVNGAAIEEGRSGIARGYVVGDSPNRH